MVVVVVIVALMASHVFAKMDMARFYSQYFIGVGWGGVSCGGVEWGGVEWGGVGFPKSKCSKGAEKENVSHQPHKRRILNGQQYKKTEYNTNSCPPKRLAFGRFGNYQRFKKR